MPLHAIVISTRNEDILFTQTIAKALDLAVHQASSVEQLRNLLIDHPQAIAFWDVDSAPSSGEKLPVTGVGQALSQYLPWEKVFALSDSALNDTPSFSKFTAFGHYFFRRFDPPAPDLYSRIIRATLMPDPFGLAQYLPEGTPLQKITIKNSTHKRAATEALSNVFTKKGLHTRIVATLTQAVDELTMNAIFDAPRDTDGKAYRQKLSRDDEFRLDGREEVSLEIGTTPDYATVCITDQFGSIEHEVIVPLLRKNYQKANLQVGETKQSSGLGLYGITQAGLSLTFVVKPGKKTQVILFLPVTDSYKSFKNSFRFFSFLVR